jgi:hypothetical protein
MTFLGVAFAIVVDAGSAEGLELVHVGLGPVDDADGIGSLRIFRIHGENLLLPSFRFIQLLDAEVDAGNVLQAVHIARILVQNLLEDADGLLRGVHVVRRVESGHYILSQRGGQIGLGHGQARVELRGPLEVPDGFFIPGALVGIHSLVQLVAGCELAAPAHGKHHAGQGHRERRNTCGSIHVLILLLQAVA